MAEAEPCRTLAQVPGQMAGSGQRRECEMSEVRIVGPVAVDAVDRLSLHALDARAAGTAGPSNLSNAYVPGLCMTED